MVGPDRLQGPVWIREAGAWAGSIRQVPALTATAVSKLYQPDCRVGNYRPGQVNPQRTEFSIGRLNRQGTVPTIC